MFIEESFLMDENLKKFLNRDLLPNDPESLKDLIISIVQMGLDQIHDFSKQNQVLLENTEYLKSEISILKTFQYGQRSERLKKKQ